MNKEQLKLLLAKHLRMILFLWVLPGLCVILPGGLINSYVRICPKGYKEYSEYQCVVLSYVVPPKKFDLSDTNKKAESISSSEYQVLPKKEFEKLWKSTEPIYLGPNESELEYKRNFFDYHFSEYFRFFIIFLWLASYPLWIVFTIFKWALKTK